MAARLPEIHVPVTVTTDGVDKGIAKTEAAIARLQAKLRRQQGPAGGAGAAGPFSGMQSRLTPFLGSVGRLGPAAGLLGGMGGMGAAAAAPFAIAGLARAQVDQMASLTKGARDALAEFRRTGEQTFSANSAILQRLAAMEEAAQARARVMGLGAAFTFGAGREGQESLLDKLSLFASQASGFIGAILGGKSLREAGLTAQIVGAGEEESRVLDARLRAEERAQAAGPSGASEVVLNAILESQLFKLDKILQMLQRN